MKKLLTILLTATLAVSCCACSELDMQTVLDKYDIPAELDKYGISSELDKLTANINGNDTQQSSTNLSGNMFNTIIRDSDCTDYCFWEDGRVWYSGFRYDYAAGDPDQYATLSTQTEYDLSFFMWEICGISQSIWNIEFEYDDTKMEIVHNPDIEERFIIDNDGSPEDHFILKVLQPCENEEFYINIWSKDPYSPLPKKHIRAFIVSTVEDATTAEQAE